MILDERELIKTGIKSARFQQGMSEVSKRYLDILPANHIFFCIENKITKERLDFSTKPEWQKYYIGRKLINNCPLYITSMNFFRRSNLDLFLFPWNKIIPEGKEQRDLLGLREEVGIANGLSLGKRIGIYEIMLGIGTVPKDTELENKYLSFMPTIQSLLEESSRLCREFEMGP